MPIDNETSTRPSASVPDDKHVAVAAVHDHTRLLFTQGQMGQAVTVGVACAVALTFWTKAPAATLVGWFSLMLLLSSWRFWLVTRFRRRQPPDAELARWRRLFFFGIICTATLFSAAWWLLAPFGGFEEQVLLAFMFGGLSLGAVAVLGSTFSIYVVYVALLCLPGMLWMFSQSSFSHITMAGLTLIFFAALVFAGRDYQRALQRNMELSSTNHTLSEQQERLSDFAAMGADLFWESDRHGCFIYLSEGYQTLTGVAASKMLGQPIDSAETPVLLPEEHANVTDASGAHVPVHDHTIDWKLPGGQGAVLLCNAVPVHDDNADFCGFRGTVRDVTDQHRLAEKLKHQATHDDLTELSNRREFERRLSAMLLNAQQGNSAHAVCFVDLDQFKIVNDTCGHAAGDALLRRIAQELQQRLRRRDTLARLGGDEFGILLEHCKPTDALALAHEVCSTIADIRFQWQEHMFSVSASIGLLAIDANSEDLASVMMAADTACYAAKEAGRNQVHLYEADDQALLRQRDEMQWATLISDALDNDRFVLLAQPILPLSKPADSVSDSHTHFELLLRMRAADDSLVAPGAFLPAAERHGLATRLDRWVVEAAFRALLISGSRLNVIDTCSINLCGQSLTDEDFIDYLAQRFREHPLLANKICFELAEATAVINLNAAIGFMERLRRFGCRFAIDDFGSGVSSYACLRNLPVDYIKIDGALVRAMADDEIDSAMIKSIHDMGSVMGMATVAEHVESTEILQRLRAIGVNYAQGNAVAKPQAMAAYGIGGKLVKLDAVADFA